MERHVLLEDLKEQVASCMLNVLKLPPLTVYGQSSAYMKAVLDYCAKHGEQYYNPVLLNKFWAETEARYKRGEITKGHYKAYRTQKRHDRSHTATKTTEYCLIGTHPMSQIFDL